jgi:hypothetical protein
MGRTERRYWAAQRGLLKAGCRCLCLDGCRSSSSLRCCARFVRYPLHGRWRRLWHQRRTNSSIVGGESNHYASHRDHDHRGCSHEENPTR